MKRFLLAMTALCITLLWGCAQTDAYRLDSPASYREIPGITHDEIAAIEQFQREGRRFSYGHLYETESFFRSDGTAAGFTIRVCDLLTELLGLAFVPQYCEEWDVLKNGLDSREIDFLGVLTPTPERQLLYSMTEPIAGRTLRLYTHADAPDIAAESDLNGLKIGFLTGTVTAQIIAKHYPALSFSAVDVDTFADVTELLTAGTIDAFVVDATADLAFEGNQQVKSKPFFAMVYTPVSIATANADLAPVISVINKYLAAGGFYKLRELYVQGEAEYERLKLYNTFSDEEKAYLDDLLRRNQKIDIGIQHDVYPVSFYNEIDGRYEGIALDILDRVSTLTGLTFAAETTTVDTPLFEILSKLGSGEISMMTQLLYTESRKNDYLWNATPYHTSRYALLSSTSLPDLEPYQVYHVRVGTILKSAHEEVFNAWFPDHEKHIAYHTTDEGFAALEKGEIDLLMLSESMLLVLTNYREKSNYKINISFSETLNSLFGYNKDEVLLRSILDKAMAQIDMAKISDNWMTRSFDYSSKISKMQTVYVSLFAVVIFIVMLTLLYLFFRYRRLGRNLLERSSKLSTIFTSIPDVIFCMDTELIYTNCNPGFERFSNMTEAEILGKRDDEVFAGREEMARYFTEVNRQVLDSGETVTIHEWVDYPDGSKRFLETTKTPLMQDGKMTGLMGIARDITAHKAAEEEAREASKVKSMFLANMSHEIRTPMNAIIGMTELLLSETLTARQQGYVTDINVSSHALLAIINDILDLSKIESGKLEINPVDYDFHVLVDNIQSMFMFVAEKKGLSFQYETHGDIPKYLYGDDVRLRQVLTNICGNAVKFTGEGYIKLSVIAEDEKMVFKIEDTGMGIRKEDLPKLFDAFSQADQKKNRHIVGTGLGLSISKNFVEMMGGTITVDSVYGQGTVFTVSIPRVAGNENNIRYEDTGGKSDRFTAPAAKILVVDDNDVNLKVASGLLNLYGIQAHTSLSGREAIALVQKTDYDIVFMDHMMPEMDGIETTAAIRKLGGKYERLIIIALTANAIHGAKEMFIASGFHDFISKPIEIGELANMLRQWLPQEKVADITEPDVQPEPSAESDFMVSVRAIREINAEIGMNRVSGVEAMYRDTLEAFYRKLSGECDKMEDMVSREDLPLFAITVHGMKSTLATIGAMTLSQTAFDLETAAKDQNPAYCREKLPPFLEALRALSERLSALFAGSDNAAPKEAGDRQFLQEKAALALAAAKDFDNDTGLAALDELLSYDYGAETNELLANAKSAFQDFDCDMAAEYLRRIP